MTGYHLAETGCRRDTSYARAVTLWRAWDGNQSPLTSVGLPVCLQGILLRELGAALVTDKGFGTS